MIGWQELLIIMVIVMLVFGTSKISGIGKSLGGAIRDFRESMSGDSSEKEHAPEIPPKEETPKEEAGTPK